MNFSQQLQFLIIGQGLAGSLLAWRLIEAGQRVLLIDKPRDTAASRVAAGLINPVTGKRLVKEPDADKFLNTARETYAGLEKLFDQKFHFDKPMLRLFDSEQIKLAWQKRINDMAYDDYLGEALSAGQCGYTCGGFLQKQTGYLATGPLLDNSREWLKEKEAYLAAQFDYGDIQVGEFIHWQGYTARNIIFCEGARVIHNPWFNYLPMQPAQGEILTLQTDDRLPEWIINGGKWVLPLDDGCFKLGATYVWPEKDKPLDETVSQEGKQKLLDALPGLLPGVENYKLLDESVGIRPNSLDKRPLIGAHPEFSNMWVFNGFGSRGSMLIPYYANHFVDVLLNGVELESEIDIKRVKTSQ